MIALLGVAAGVPLLVAAFAGGVREVQRFGRLDRVPVPGQAVLSLPAGKHVVYLESTRGEPPVKGVDVRVAEAATGSRWRSPLTRPRSPTTRARSGRAVSTLVIPDRRRYRVAAAGSADARLNVAVGPPLGGKLSRAVSSVLLGFGCCSVGRSSAAR